MPLLPELFLIAFIAITMPPLWGWALALVNGALVVLRPLVEVPHGTIVAITACGRILNQTVTHRYATGLIYHPVTKIESRLID
jgi:hypothetical protein